MQVTARGGPLTRQTVRVDDPPTGWVRVEVRACGVCLADVSTMRGTGGHPITPGHEIAGVVTAVGGGVLDRQIGDRVAVGWFGGSCGRCDTCRRGDVAHCAHRRLTGVDHAGGWAETVTVPADSVAAVPDGMDLAHAAPMGCAGVTTFLAVRDAGLRPGSTVAVLGIGGVGHLAVRFAAAMGHRVIALARGPERADLARELGADDYLDVNENEAGAALRDRGGADLIVASAPTTGPVTELLRGLAVRGRLTMLGVDGGTVDVAAARLVANSQILTGNLPGGPRDIEDALTFAHRNGVTPMIERMPLDRAEQAVERITAGRARFRIVLEPAGAP